MKRLFLCLSALMLLSNYSNAQLLSAPGNTVEVIPLKANSPYKINVPLKSNDAESSVYILIGSRDKDNRLYNQQSSKLLNIDANEENYSQIYFPDPAAVQLEVKIITVKGDLNIGDISTENIQLDNLPPDSNRPEQEFWFNIDYYDMIYYCDTLGLKTYEEKEIVELFSDLKERKVTGVLWRVSLLGQMLYHSKVSTMPPGKYPRAKLDAPMLRTVEIIERIDPLAIAIREARKNGIKIVIWVTVDDEAGWNGGPWWNQFILDTPDAGFIDRNGVQQWGTMCYDNPKTLDFRLRQLQELIDYQSDGIFYSFRYHGSTNEALETGERYGYNPQIVKKYKERFDVDLLAHPIAEGRVLYMDGRRWNEIKAEGYDKLIEESAKMIHNANQELFIDITSANHRYREGMFGAYTILNWDSWVKNRWVDKVIVGVWQQEPYDIYNQALKMKELMYPDQSFYFWMQINTYGGKNYPVDNVISQMQSAALGNSNGIAVHELYDFAADVEYWNKFQAAHQQTNNNTKNK